MDYQASEVLLHRTYWRPASPRVAPPPTAGKEFHHNRLSLIASISAWGATRPARAAVGPAPNDGNGDRLLYTERVSVQGRSAGPWPSRRQGRYRSIDEHPSGGQGRRRLLRGGCRADTPRRRAGAPDAMQVLGHRVH